MDLYNKLEQVSRQFRIEGTYVGYETICIGNVNKTYEVKFVQNEGKEKSFLVQNVNTYAFRKPIELMENIDKVTEHIRSKKEGLVSLHFHHTADRKTYVLDGENFWRMTNYIPSKTYNGAIDPEIIHNAGVAFGEFQMQLADFDINELHETIPDFHNTRARFRQLRDAVSKDPVGRVAEVQEELDYLFSVEDEACRLTDMQLRGELPLRVTHNDTKINNVLFSPIDKRAMVVVDLDTVMPGLVGHDFGDAIRFAANREVEDSRNLDKVCVDMGIFKAFAEGFLEMTAGTLTKNEIDTLAMSPFVLAVELSTRFLADYILGDPYFNIMCPDHNLARTRCQIALAKDIRRHFSEMNAIIVDSLEKASCR